MGAPPGSARGPHPRRRVLELGRLCCSQGDHHAPTPAIYAHLFAEQRVAGDGRRPPAPELTPLALLRRHPTVVQPEPGVISSG
ncbi:unnamed protein product [Urochloa humidicola]